MKKIFVLLLLSIFLFSFAAAEVAVITQENDTTVDYKIDNGAWAWLPDWLGGETLGIFTKDYSENSLTKATAGGHGEYFVEAQLVDAIDFYNNDGENVNHLMTDIKLYYAQAEDVTYQIPVYTETCETINYPVNGTTYESCTNEITSYNEEFVEEWNFQEYNGELIIGKFKWKLEVVKPLNMHVDWVLTVFGQELLRWDWWDSDWQYKRSITGLNGSISALYYLNSTILSGENLSTVRFIDYETETIELDYDIAFQNSTHIGIRFANYPSDKAYVYYGNDEAADNSNASAVYFTPVAGYYFDKNANDFSGNDNNGTVSGATLTNDGYIDGAYDFDGNNDAITIPISKTFTNTSISFWMNWDDVGTDNTQFITESATTDDFLIHTGGSAGVNGIRWNLGTGGVPLDSTGIISSGWHHYVMTYNDSIATIYKDGILNNSASLAWTNPTVTTLYIGARGGSSLWFDGRLDEFYIYDYALNLTEIGILYNQTQPDFTLGIEEENNNVVIELLSPTDSFISNETLNNFSCSAEAFGLTEIFQSAINITNFTSGEQVYYNEITDITNDTYMIFNWTDVLLDNGEYSWECSANWGEFRSATILAKDTARDQHGIAVGTTFNATGGNFGTGGFEFDGDSDRIDAGVTGDFDILNDITISAWVKTSSTGSTKTIFSNRPTGNDYYGFRLDSSNKLQFVASVSGVGDACTASSSITSGEWTNVIVTFSNSTLECNLYVNNNNVKPADILSVGLATHNGQAMIGTIAQNPSAEEFNGSMSGIFIFERIINSTEIASLYSSNTIIDRSGLVAEYKMDEKFRQYVVEINQTIDQSGNGNNGTLSSGMELNESAVRWGYRGANFDGVGDVIDTPATVTGENVTISLWMRAKNNTPSDFEYLIYDSSNVLVLETDGRISLKFNNAWGFFGTSSANGIVDTDWHNVVGWYNGIEKRIYIDGIEKKATSQTGNVDMNSGLTISKSSNTFNGSMDDVRIFNRSLSESEILELYNTNNVSDNSDLVAYWDMEEIFTTTSPSTRKLTVDTTDPVITILSPTQGQIINNPSENITLNFSISEDGVGLDQCWWITDQNLTKNFISCSQNSSFLYPADNPTNLTLYLFANDSVGFNGSDNVTIFKSIVGPVINITSPIDSYNFLHDNQTLDLNYTLATNGTLDTCWYSYNGVNSTVNCSENTTQFQYEANINSLTFYANDTFGNEDNLLRSWEVSATELSQTFPNETIEGAIENFSIEMNTGDGIEISAAVFVYNGEDTLAEISISAQDTTVSVESFQIPPVEADINITFGWRILLSDSTTINTTTNNVTVLNIQIDNCSTFTKEILELTMVDEEMQTSLSNTTIEFAADLLSSDRATIIANISGQFENENPVSICISRNLTNGISYLFDSVIRYTANGYANEYYNIVGVELDEDSETELITLYNLNITDSTEFQLTFTGDDFLPVEDALIFVERQYISENTFKTVELPKTDSNGQTILHMVRNDIIYNIRVVKDGEILGLFTNLIAFCDDFSIGNCKIALNALSGDSAVTSYDDIVGIVYDSPPEFNDTSRVIAFSYSSVDGTSKVATMSVRRNDVFGNQTICTNTVVSSSGTLFCTVDSDITDTNLITEIIIDGEVIAMDSTNIDDTAYGSEGYFAWFILSIILALMMASSKSGILISQLIGFIGAVSMGWSVGGIIGIGSAGVWVIILILVAIWKVNRNRSS